MKLKYRKPGNVKIPIEIDKFSILFNSDFSKNLKNIIEQIEVKKIPMKVLIFKSNKLFIRGKKI
jgi:hypothetical protein